MVLSRMSRGCVFVCVDDTHVTVTHQDQVDHARREQQPDSKVGKYRSSSASRRVLGMLVVCVYMRVFV